MINNYNRILVLAPHTDDGELGCGGTIHKLINQGKDVYYAAFSICEESVPEGFPKNILGTEVKKATKVLGIQENNLIIKDYKVRYFKENRQRILEDLVALNKQLKPDLVLCPATTDIHQDHQAITQESIRAFKNISIIGYEFIWNSFVQKTNLFISLSQENISAKINSLKEYNSQGFRVYTSQESIITMAKYKGLQVKKEFVEAFEVIRLISE